MHQSPTGALGLQAASVGFENLTRGGSGRGREALREILTRRQPNVVRLRLNRWCSNVLRAKVEAMKEVAEMPRAHRDGILAWVASRQTNGFLEALNGLFQAAKRQARGYGRLRTIRMAIFMIAGKLDCSRTNPPSPHNPLVFQHNHPWRGQICASVLVQHYAGVPTGCARSASRALKRLRYGVGF